MATKVDAVPSANSAKMPLFTLIGLIGVVCGLAVLFVNPLSGYNVNPLYVILGIGGSLCQGVAMFYVYTSLAKGMINLPTPLTTLLKCTGWSVLAYQGLMSIGLLLILMSGNLLAGGAISTIAALIGFVYFILYIIVGCKIMSNYEGKLKLLGILFVAIPAIMIVSAIIGGAAAIGGASGITTILSFIGAACSAYQYLVAYQVICGK